MSKGIQLRKGAVLTRARKGPPKPVGAGGGAVDLMVELLSCCLFLPPSAPLVAFACGGGRWLMWTQEQDTRLSESSYLSALNSYPQTGHKAAAAGGVSGGSAAREVCAALHEDWTCHPLVGRGCCS